MKWSETYFQCNIGMGDIPQPDPPVVGKVTHNSIELYWDEKNDEKPMHGKTHYCIQEEEVNMRSTGFGNVYSGYAKRHVFEGLEPQTRYRYVRIYLETCSMYHHFNWYFHCVI